MPNFRDSLEREKRIAKEFVREKRIAKVDEFIQEDTKTKQTYFFGFFPNCIWPYKRGKKLENNTEEIQRLKREYIFEIIADLRRRADDVRYSSQYYISFKSRESEYKELLDALKDDNNYITGLQGMGGTGKTTLAIEVGKELKQSEQFSHVIDTTVSFTPDIKKIQDDIAGPLGMKLENCSESERAIKLWRRLTNGEKILLIVDDVWDQNQFIFEAIGIPNRDDHKGCRVLVTTRCRQMLYKMNCDKRIELDLLTEEDAWIMFERYAGISNSSSNSVIRKGREIAKECKQLPIAIAVMARSCKGHGDIIVEWDMTLKSLKNRASIHYVDEDMAGVDEDMAGIYKALKFSYDYITDEKAKGLFLLCSIFQENEEISIEVLTRFIIGAGLFEDNYGNYDDTRNRVIVAKNKLLDHYLLLEVGEKHVKMHDLVREMAQWIANKEDLGVINLSETNQKLFVERETNIRNLSCEGKDVDLFSCKFEGSNLETLIVKLDRDEDRKCIEVPNSFFENLVKLRVLYFLGNEKRPLSLPHSIRLLKNIRSLLVDSVDLGDISILGNLQSLETLDLVQCTINEFPKEITKLEKFTLLKLEYCEIIMNNPFEVIEKCSSLEELYFIDSFNGFCQEITLPKLQRYHISKGLDVMNDSLSAKVFQANDNADYFSKATLNYIMQTAEVLRLNQIKGEWRNLMPEIVPLDQDTRDLVELRLSCISQLQCLIDTDGSQVPTVLSNLTVLELNRMENLEELFKGTLSMTCMESLEELSINDCKYLKSLFKCKLNLCNLKTIKLQSCPMLVSLYQLLTSQSLLSLETLKIGHCEKLENIIADERRDDSENNKCLDSMLQKLKVLDIEGCPLLESIFPFLFVQDLPVLETIKIRRCDGLKYIFGQYQDVVLFTSLKQLELSQLPNFIDMFCKYNHPTSLSEKGSSSTSNFGSKTQLQLDYSESNSHCLNNKCVGSLFPKLEALDIEGCPLLEYIFPFLFFHELPVLETIKIRKCAGLKYIFGQYQHVEFSSLRQLELSQLPDFIDMFFKSNHLISLSEKGSSSTSNHGSKAQLRLDLDPVKYNIFSWDTTTTTIPLLDGHYSESNSYCLNIWERVQCLQIPSNILYSIKKIELSQFSKIKSVFIPSIAPRMLLETLTIRNCDELKNIIDFGDYESGSNNWGDVFPKMKELYIEDCPKMDYIFGHDTNDHQNQVEIQLQLLELKCLSLCNLPSLVAMCPKHYRIRFPPLSKLELNKCSSAATKSMSQFIIDPVSESLDSTIIKGIEIIEEASTSKTRNEPPRQLVADLKQKGKLSVEDITTSSLPTAKTITSSPEYGDEQIAIPVSISTSEEPLPTIEDVDIESSQETTQTNNQVSLNDDAFMKVNSNTEEQFPKDDEILVSSSRLSSAASHFPSMPSKDFDLYLHMESVYRQFQEESKGHHNGNENTSAQTTKEFAAWIEAEIASRHKLISSEVVEKNVEEGTTSTDAKTTTSSTNLGSSSGPLVTSECETFSQIKLKQTPDAEHEVVENGPDLEMQSVALLPTNSDVI